MDPSRYRTDAQARQQALAAQRPAVRKTPTSSSAYGSFAAAQSPAGFSSLPPRKSVGESSQSELLKALSSPRGSSSSLRPSAPARPTAAVSRPTSKPAASSSESGRPEGPPCDRCDGNHKTALCPHFKKGRDDHEDARVHLDQKGIEDPDAPPVIVRGRVIPQPGDGSCLFHSLGRALHTDDKTLRAEVTRYIELNGESSIAGTALKKWVNWDSGTDARAYASRMRQRGSWGGALEMAVVAQMKDVAIHVYEKQPRQAGSFKRIATFGDAGRSDESAAHVLYGGRVHYDALEIFH